MCFPKRPRPAFAPFPGEKRLRVGDYRVRFTEEHPDTLRIHAVRHRKDAYR
ncbi:MAG: type II toxin-antitoxin system RelE/ParE family toxin [Bryobacteraceae bacterium]